MKIDSKPNSAFKKIIVNQLLAGGLSDYFSVDLDGKVSANLDVKFYRDDNDLTGDCLTKYLDFHYEINSIGSEEQFSK